MIFANGLIYPIIKTGGGITANGNPCQPSNSLGESIPCRIKENRRNNIGKLNGNTFIIASYEILIDKQQFDANRVKLERFGHSLGEFSVISIEPLDAVNCIKILV
jgi:hypothetical protein